MANSMISPHPDLNLSMEDLRLILGALSSEVLSLRERAETYLAESQRLTQSDHIVHAEDMANAYRADAESMAELLERVRSALTS